MDARLEALLDELYRAGREHDAAKEDRLARLRNVEPDTARLLGVLVRATGAKRILEIGTSNGYSTIWLAEAARATGGGVVSIEVEAERTEQARANLARAGLAELVELRVEDAGATLAGAPEDAYELVFLDAERPAYAGYWPELVRTIAPGGLLVVDNVISHADQLTEFRALVAGDDRVTEAEAPTGAGALLVVMRP